MSNTSWRHHFIPQFYLKGFTSKNGTFKIYDVNKAKFVKDGKDFYPESYFFEIDDNSIITENGKDDIIEHFYKKFDCDASEIFNRINTSNSSVRFNVNDNDIALLQYFIGLMYWRIPTNKDSLVNLINSNSFKDLGLKIRRDNKDIEDVDYENELKMNPNFSKFIKYHYPSFFYHQTFDCKTPLHIRSFQEGGPLVCSDNPIICVDPFSFNIYRDDLIFPLNATRLFIRGNSLRKYSQTDFTGVIKIEIDMLLYKQAVKYVSFTDERYRNELDKLFDKYYKNLTVLRKSVMSRLINYTA